MKKATIVGIYHMLLWLSYSIIVFISPHDKLRAKIMLFAVFLYVAYVIANYVLQKRRYAFHKTVRNGLLLLIIYSLIRFLFWN